MLYITCTGQQIYYNGKQFSNMTFYADIITHWDWKQQAPIKGQKTEFRKKERINIAIVQKMWQRKQKPQRTKNCPFTCSNVFWVSGPFAWTVTVLSSAFRPQARKQAALVPDETAFRIGSLAPVDSSGILLHRWADRRISPRVSWSPLMCQSLLLSAKVSISNPTLWCLLLVR